MNFEHLSEIVQNHQILVYVIILPIAIFEGPVLAMFVGMFIKLGYLALIPSALVMILGDFLPDSFYYYIGRFGHNWKFSKKLLSKLDDESLIIKLWNRHTIKTLIASKLAFGISPALLLTAGVARMPYPRFIRWSLLITVLQYGIFMTIGYLIGYSYQAVQSAKFIGIVITVIIILIFVMNGVIKKFAQKEIKEMEEEEIKEEAPQL